MPVEGDILYSREGERFGIAATVPSGVRLCISQRMMVFRVRKTQDSDLLMWQLNCPHVYAQASVDVIGSTAPHGRRGQDPAPAVPRLHDEAGHRRGLHPRRAQELHDGQQLLQAGQDHRERPRVRREEGAQEAAPLRREQRHRDPPQGRDHGRPLPRAGDRAPEDQGSSPRDGRDERHPARGAVLPGVPGVPRRPQEPLSRDRRVLG